jgi:hypothetical protein
MTSFPEGSRGRERRWARQGLELGRLGVHGFSVLLGAKPRGFIETRVCGRGGFALGRMAIRDQAFDGDDHGDGLDL